MLLLPLAVLVVLLEHTHSTLILIMSSHLFLSSRPKFNEESFSEKRFCNKVYLVIYKMDKERRKLHYISFIMALLDGDDDAFKHQEMKIVVVIAMLQKQKIISFPAL